MKKIIIIGLAVVVLLVPLMARGMTLSEIQKKITELLVMVTQLQLKLAALQSPVSLPTRFATHSYDVVVVGAGSGGSAAAIQAARLGMKVALIEETDWVGGQMTAAAVPNMDGGSFTASGIYTEFIDKAKRYYDQRGKGINTCYFILSSQCFEVSVLKNILQEMIARAGEKGGKVDLFFREKVTRVTKSGNTVTGVVTNKNKQYNAKVVIDATEYGDVIPLTGARYRIGNTVNGAGNPTACVQDITYSAVIKKYTEEMPAGFLITTPPPGYTDEVRDRFAQNVALNGKTRPYTGYPINWDLFVAYRGMPDSSGEGSYNSQEPGKITRTAINYPNDYPAPVPYIDESIKMPIQYVQDANYRKKENCNAKLKTLQFLYYIQTVLGKTEWSIANDEGYDTSYNREEQGCSNIPAEFKILERNMPPISYVREARRLVGLHTLTAGEIKRSAQNQQRSPTDFPTSVATGDYAIDLHNCGEAEYLEADLESRGDIPSPNYGGPFEIPFEALIPEVIDGFVAAEKNISVSRLANGATRLQPVTMATGQAAGTIAALAVKNRVQPRKVNVLSVQKELVDANAMISHYIFPDVPVTNGAWKEVQLISTLGIMKGFTEGNFDPTVPLTRAQAALMFSRLLDLPLSNKTGQTFSDVSPSHPQFKEIEAIYTAGITQGCAANPLRYCPSETMTRTQFAVMLSRVLGKKSQTMTPHFQDVPANAAGFKEIQYMYEAGLSQGCSENPIKFCPNSIIVRQQAAAMVARALWEGLLSGEPQ